MSRDKIDRRILRVSADPDLTWRAWGDPAIIESWFADAASGSAEVGGELVHSFDKFGLELRYRVIESRRPDLLVLEGASPTGHRFRQEIHIRADGGETVLELIHSGFADDDWDGEYEGVDSGWKLSLALLRHYLERHPERRRRLYFAMRPIAIEIPAARQLYTTAAGLERWLADRAAIESEHWALDLGLLGPLHGRVLADSGRELAIVWEEIDGALELKIFEAGPAVMAALRAHSWADEPPQVEAVEAWMASALERLNDVIASV
jgi:uncharacterized protein YndB with AHSA1/START domain